MVLLARLSNFFPSFYFEKLKGRPLAKFTGVNKIWTGSDRIGLTKPGPDRTGLTKPGSD